MSRGHGERWEALLGTTDDLKDRLSRMIPVAKILPRSDLQTAWHRDHPEAADYSMFAWPNDHFRMAVVTHRNPGEHTNVVVSAFPLMEAGDTARMELLDIILDEDHGEAELVMLLRDGREITLFDPLFILHRQDLQTGWQYAVALTGLAYSINKSEKSFAVTEGPMLDEERRRVAAKNPKADVSSIHSVDLSLEHMRYLNPRDDEESDAEFFMKATDVRWFTMDDIPICRMVGLATHRENGRPIRLVVYASKHVLKGYDPAPGDLLNGLIWLQGVPLRRMRQTERWADRVLPESPQALFDAHRLGEEAEAKFPDEHPGVLAFVSALGQTGWTIEPLANKEPTECSVCLSMRHDDHEIQVLVRAFRQDVEQDCVFTREEKQRLAPAGLPCVFVTVKCEDAGTHLRLSYTGHEAIEALTGDLQLFTYIRKPGTLDSEEPDEQGKGSTMKSTKRKLFERFGRLDTWIVGLQYYGGADAAVNQEVVFDREPDNPFDPNAIAVFTTAGTQVGHLPRYDAEYFSPLILQGVIALKGHTGETERGDRLPLALEVFATSKVSEILIRDPSDDWRAIYHNVFIDIWERLPEYTSATLREFRDRFRPLAHDQPLFPKTQFLYRMLKAHIADLEGQERQRLREQVLASVKAMDFGPVMGWPELTVIPLDANGDASQVELTPPAAETVTALAHTRDQLPDVLRLLPSRCPYPADARGAVVLVHGAWHSLDWFGSPECAQVYWYQMILSGIENALRQTPPATPPDTTPEDVKTRILEALQRAECTVTGTEEGNGGSRVDIATGDRAGHAVYRTGDLIRLNLREAIDHGTFFAERAT